MQRYFMTVREAVGLVLQASVLGVGDAELPAARDGGIFVLDMGKPVKIVDLARQMIRLAGLLPEKDVEIRFTGLRPGEKLYEELFHGNEPPEPTGYPGLLMATPRTADPAIVGRALDEIATACRGGQARLALTLLGRLVPEFAHNADGAQADARAGTRSIMRPLSSLDRADAAASLTPSPCRFLTDPGSRTSREGSRWGESGCPGRAGAMTG
jgi:FlaA1/EpsC-like NDP-sugar epimerase